MENDIFKLVKRAKKYNKYLLYRSFGALLSALLTIVGAYIWAWAIDLAIAGTTIEYSKFVIYVIVFVLVRSLLNYANPITSLKYASNSIRLIRNDYAKKIINFKVNYYEKNDTGVITSGFINAINEIEDFLDNSIANYIFVPCQIIVGSCYLAYINWKFMIISLVVVLPIISLSKKLSKKLKIYSKSIHKANSKFNGIFRDLINGVTMFKVFNANVIFDKKVNEVYDELNEENKKFERQNLYIKALEKVSDFLPTMLCFSIGGYFAFKGEITPGELVGFTSSIGFVLQGIVSIPQLMSSTQRANGAAAFLEELISYDKEKINDKKIESYDSKSVISFNDVYFAYDGDDVLKGINFDVYKNERVAIVGESGCGKTTIFNLLCGFYDNYRGDINVYDYKLKELNIKNVREHISVVSQNAHLYNVSIKENIRYGDLNATDEEIIAAAKKANIHDFIESLDNKYETIIDEKGINVSGGQRQRIAIARALIKNSKILLLDEATSALDEKSQESIMKTINDNFSDRTVIVIAHRLSTITESKKILVMKNGVIDETGTHERLFDKKGSYYDLYNKILSESELK